MRITILGMGKMGSWLVQRLSEGNNLALYDIDETKARGIGNENVKVLSDLSEIGELRPELLINAVSLENTIEAFEEAGDHLTEDCIISDIASIKNGMPDYYRDCGFRFVSVHPMFGPTFADMDSLRQENAVIMKESDREGASFFRRFFQGLGLKIYEYTFKEHDELMSYSLTLPFTASLVFAACVNTTVVPGTTFKKHKEIADRLLSENDHLLAEILFNQHSLNQLDKITSKLEFLKHVIRGRDYEEAKKLFDRLRSNLE